MDYVRVTAALDKASTLKDGSVRLVFDTAELDSERMALLFSMRNEVGHLIFSRPNTTIEVPEEKPGVFKQDHKKRSVQLRGILFRLWEKLPSHAGFKTPEEHYNYEMDRIIDHYLEKLR